MCIVFVKTLGSVCFWGELGLSAIGDWYSLVWRGALPVWAEMIELDEKGFNVAWHSNANATATICIVPFDINTSKFISGHVELDPV